MTILAFTTDTDEGHAALRWALANREHPGEPLHVDFAHSDKPSVPAPRGWQPAGPLADDLRAAGAVHHAPGAEPAETTLALAEELRPRLLVAGIRHRTATMKLILGSHIQHLLLNSACPVVCVKT
ncbi:universal stress protein [Amycolatopsis thermoflava]|uniref:Universal stress protein family protein n=1 Tax=Amycolatopsis thermoflava TaxID=84480 RepID=A0A3N2H623_9PSEU|nr:universal stress protein [Amycolatopsis thermoflava]ROS44356.1 universal stress protein family protein [Amycolatopsis thermoflava]